MTNEEKDREVMTMFNELRDSEQLVACIRSKLLRIADAIPAFIGNVDAKERGVLVNIEERVSDIAEGYENAVRKSSQLKRNLEQAGYGHILAK